MTTFSKKLLSYLLKAVLLALAFTFIYFEYLKKGDNLKQFKNSISTLSHTYVIAIMSLVLLLMLVNWVLECLKWQFLTRHLVPITLWRAIEGVFCGLTWAIFTPNRVGEYGGRVMFLPPRKRIHGFFAMMVGTFGQLVVTNVMGGAALLWFIYTFLHLTPFINFGITLLGLAFMALFITLFFNVRWFVWTLNKVPFLKKYHRFFDVMGTYGFAELFKIMGFCFARFCVFIFQYYLVIHMLIPGLPFYQIVLMVILVLFIRSNMPSFDLIDLAIRSAVATTIFAYITGQQVAIVAAFSAIWFINLVIPALLGSVFIFKLKFFDRNV